MDKKLITYIDYRSNHNILIEPLTVKELKQLSFKDGYISQKLRIPLNFLIDNDIEALNDEVSERITGSITGLSGIDYKIAGKTTTNEVILKVTGFVEYDML